MAALVLLTTLILGGAWFTISALQSYRTAAAERETRTASVLISAKKALLQHVAVMAASTSELSPGRLPCPEVRSQVGTANDGFAGPFAGVNCDSVGRLPWRTLGQDEFRDGFGEPLWYAVGTGTWAWNALNDPLVINPGTANAVFYDGANTVVAVIIAPGQPINAAGTPPAGCAAVNQMSNRYATPYVTTQFLECGNSTGNYTATPRTDGWGNDRTISITAAEVMDAISGAIGDRVQRQVAPVIGNWDADERATTGRSWGSAPPFGHNLPYLPFASTWGNPSTTDYCANQNGYEGLMPIDPSCYNNNWTGNSVAASLFNLIPLGNCTNPAGTTYRRCRFTPIVVALLGFVRITLTTNDVARAFRGTIVSSDIIVRDGSGLLCTACTATISSMTIPNGTSDATVVIDVYFPATSILSLNDVEVRVPHLQPAGLYTDSRITWFWNNQWHRYTYYGVAPGATANPVVGTTCGGSTGRNCLITANGLPVSHGNMNDKRVVLVVGGRPLAGVAQPSGTRGNYFEGDNATPNDQSYLIGAMSSSFNDRLAMCPFQHTTATGTMSICN